MKKFKFIKTIALALTMTMLCSTTAFADSHDLPHFDFEQMTLNLAPGDHYKFAVDIGDGTHTDYEVYVVGKTSKKTYVWGDFKTGSSKLDIYIGEDETAKRVTLYFYILDTDTWDTVDINIVDPMNSAVLETRKKAYAANKEQQDETQKLLDIYYKKLAEKEAKKAAAQ